jgi:hypothetical protein
MASLCYIDTVKQETLMNRDDENTIELIGLAVLMILSIGILVRWAFTSWLGFFVVSALVILLLTVGH